jgi:hypothetical protein
VAALPQDLSLPVAQPEAPVAPMFNPATSEPIDPVKPASPEPKPAQPEPKPASPQPKPAQPEPKPASPQPKPAQPEPKPAPPQPASPQPKRAQPESKPHESSRQISKPSPDAVKAKEDTDQSDSASPSTNGWIEQSALPTGTVSPSELSQTQPGELSKGAIIGISFGCAAVLVIASIIISRRAAVVDESSDYEQESEDFEPETPIARPFDINIRAAIVRTPSPAIDRDSMFFNDPHHLSIFSHATENTDFDRHSDDQKSDNFSAMLNMVNESATVSKPMKLRYPADSRESGVFSRDRMIAGGTQYRTNAPQSVFRESEEFFMSESSHSQGSRSSFSSYDPHGSYIDFEYHYS